VVWHSKFLEEDAWGQRRILRLGPGRGPHVTDSINPFPYLSWP